MAPGFLRRDWWRKRSDASVPQRWVVIDCETSGLDPERDELLAIGGVGVRVEQMRLRVEPADSFEILVRPRRASRDENVLVHGIGRGTQAQAEPPADALARFVAWVDRAPLVAFHAPFDRTFLQRACARERVTPPERNWLDLAQLAPALFPQARLRTLDEWLAEFGLGTQARHSAPADAFATALLLARLLPVGTAQGARRFEDLRALAKSVRWIA